MDQAVGTGARCPEGTGTSLPASGRAPGALRAAPHPGRTHSPCPRPWTFSAVHFPPSRDLAMGKPESPVGMVEIAGWSGQKRPGLLEGGLLLLLLLLSVALVALGLLYAARGGGE